MNPIEKIGENNFFIDLHFVRILYKKSELSKHGVTIKQFVDSFMQAINDYRKETGE